MQYALMAEAFRYAIRPHVVIFQIPPIFRHFTA
jgi:hypothetical protein